MQPGFLPAIAAAIGAAAADVVYILVLHAEGEGDLERSRVLFIATSIGLAALLAALGAFVTQPVTRFVLLAVASGLLVAFTILGAMSIGILLLLPALLAMRAASHTALQIPVSFAWVLAATGGVAAVVTIASLGIAGSG